MLRALIPSYVLVQDHITCLLAPLPERALSALDCFGDRCDAAVGLDEDGTALYLGAHLPLVSTEIAVPASHLPIDVQVTLSPPSGSIVLLLRQGATISAQSTSNGSIGDGLTSPKESKAELKVGAIWLGRAGQEAPAA